MRTTEFAAVPTASSVKVVTLPSIAKTTGSLTPVTVIRDSAATDSPAGLEVSLIFHSISRVVVSGLSPKLLYLIERRAELYASRLSFPVSVNVNTPPAVAEDPVIDGVSTNRSWSPDL